MNERASKQSPLDALYGECKLPGVHAESKPRSHSLARRAVAFHCLTLLLVQAGTASTLPATYFKAKLRILWTHHVARCVACFFQRSGPGHKDVCISVRLASLGRKGASLRPWLASLAWPAPRHGRAVGQGTRTPVSRRAVQPSGGGARLSRMRSRRRRTGRGGGLRCVEPVLEEDEDTPVMSAASSSSGRATAEATNTDIESGAYGPAS